MTTALFGPQAHQRRAIRSAANPIDKSTIVSVYPKDIDERKATIFPGRFEIPKGSVEKPSLLVVGTSSWWRDINPEEPLLEIVQSSMVIAESVVNDYCNGLLGFTRNFAQPGLFWVPGAFKTIEDIKKADFTELIGVKGIDLFNRAVKMQENYWKALVKLADIGWTKTGGNPLSISDDMRFAAHNLNLKEKPWMKEVQMMALVPCPNCGTSRNPDYPTCPHCKAVIDTEKAKALGIKFAQ